MNLVNKLTFLRDVSDRDKPWDAHGNHRETVLTMYGMGSDEQYERYAQRMMNCSPHLEFQFQTNEDGEQRLKLKNARFCRVRHCPVCQWRRSLAWTARAKTALPQILEKYPKHRWILVTLTVKNCAIGELKETIRKMNKAFTLLTKRKVWPGVGWIKSVEVTAPKNKNYAHPHFHVLVMVPSTYFHGDYYLSQVKWAALWADCLRIDYMPVVDVRAVKNKSGDAQQGIEKAIVETLKYSVKESDLVLDLQWLLQLTDQMHNVRAVSIGGCFKEYFNPDEPKDLINVDGETDEDDIAGIKLYFDWRRKHKAYIKRET